jgi:hypothetical protein
MKLFGKNDRIKHEQYGFGTISSTDEQYTVIEFDEHGRKMFVTTMVSLEPTNEPAPTPAPRAKRARKAKKAAAESDAPAAPAKKTRAKKTKA